MGPESSSVRVMRREVPRRGTRGWGPTRSTTHGEPVGNGPNRNFSRDSYPGGSDHPDDRGERPLLVRQRSALPALPSDPRSATGAGRRRGGPPARRGGGGGAVRPSRPALAAP